MKTFVGLFLCSASFGITIAVIYWIVAHEATGTVLLGVMTTAMVFAAAYAILAERDAALDGDDAEATNAQHAGEELGAFTTSSAWPIVTAVGAGIALCGLPWSPFLSMCGLVIVILALWRMGSESARLI